MSLRWWFSPEMGKIPCHCLDGVDVVGVGSSLPDLEEESVAVVLPGPDRGIVVAGEDRRTYGMSTTWSESQHMRKHDCEVVTRDVDVMKLCVIV
ncbi:hypothetical protein ACLOJK_003893 [Asimina triloba]